MAEIEHPGGTDPPRFIRSRVRRAAEAARTDADREMAARHGYTPPQPPPGTDPRLWCAIHHRMMAITKPPFRRLYCSLCIPMHNGASANGGRVSVRTGLRCARVKCFNLARYDLWGVPVCSETCVAKIGDGAGVRPLGVPLRVVAIPQPHGKRWVVVACYPMGHTRRRTSVLKMVRLHWWLPGRTFPGSTRLCIPRKDATQPYPSVQDDAIMARFLVRIARAERTPSNFPDLTAALCDWRRGQGPRPWIDTTLEPAIRRAHDLVARIPGLRRYRTGSYLTRKLARPRFKPAEVGEQHGVRCAVMPVEMYWKRGGKPLDDEPQRGDFPLPEPARAAPDLGLNGDERQPAGNDEATPEPEADTG